MAYAPAPYQGGYQNAPAPYQMQPGYYQGDLRMCVSVCVCMCVSVCVCERIKRICQTSSKGAPGAYPPGQYQDPGEI